MPDDPDLIGQNEIEDLLSQAKGAAEASPQQASASDAVPQDEIDSLLNSIGDGAAAANAHAAIGGAAAVATAVSPASQASGAPGATGSQVGDDVQFPLEQAEQAIAADGQEAPSPAGVSAFKFQDFAGEPASTEKATLDLLRDVQLDLKIELGRTQMELEEVLKLRCGSVVTLDKLAGDPVDVYVNGRLVARGEVLVLSDSFCVRVAELVSGNE
ncbi:MAG: flagellar motor switch protein FliN [Planctomycetaceae bacterium]|jgi:flagellar motor switch protein FliN/FliY|nr:flagellar motor switch protein FliN [Planctomycetaceae bacterium]